jgi:G3E family GTPase
MSDSWKAGPEEFSEWDNARVPNIDITPVTVLTGFLGSGKTSLVNRLVGDERFADTAVLVNEWGEVPVDHALVRTSSENLVVLAGGCVCCRVAGDLVGALRELHFGRASGTVPPFRRAVIETTGLADPAPLLATLVELPLVAARYSLAGVVTVVDGVHGMATLEAQPEAVKQVAVADVLVVSKRDLASGRAIARLEARVREINPAAALLGTGVEPLDPARLLETGLHRGGGRVADAEGWLRSGAYRPIGAGAPRHASGIVSFAWTTEEPRAWDDVEEALAALLELRGDRILRMKGLVAVAGEPGPRAVHAVQHTLYPSARLPAWPSEDHTTRLVFIGRGLEEREVAGMLD